MRAWHACVWLWAGLATAWLMPKTSAVGDKAAVAHVRVFEQCCKHVTGRTSGVVLFSGSYNGTQLAEAGVRNGAVGCVRVVASSRSRRAGRRRSRRGVLASDAATAPRIALLFSGMKFDGAGAVVTEEWDSCAVANRIRGKARSLRVGEKGVAKAAVHLDSMPQVTLWDTGMFRGRRADLRVGGYTVLREPAIRTIQSVTVPRGIMVYLYKQRDFRGLAWVLQESQPRLSELGLERSVQSILVAPTEYAVLYPACDFRGSALLLSRGLHTGGFPSKFPLARSIIVPPRMSVSLHRSATLSALARTMNTTHACIGGFASPSIRFMSAEATVMPLAPCAVPTPDAATPAKAQQGRCDVDVTFMSLVPFSVRVQSVHRADAAKPDVTVTTATTLRPFASDTVTGMCERALVRVTAVSPTVVPTSLVLLEAPVPVTPITQRVGPHRPSWTVSIQPCRPPHIPKPVRVDHAFKSGQLMVRVGHPGPHRTVGAPQSYNVRVDLGRLFAPITMSVGVDRQVLCPACHGTGATHTSRLHNCRHCNGTGETVHTHAMCTAGPASTVDTASLEDGSDVPRIAAEPPQVEARWTSGCATQVLRRTCPTCGGHGKVVQVGAECPRCNGERTVRIKDNVKLAFVPGAEDGTTCTFPRKGAEGPFTDPGDVVFTMTTRGHGGFEREGPNIVSVLNITLAEALAGVNTTVKHLNGTAVPLVVPGVISPGRNATIRGAGLPIVADEDRIGGETAASYCGDNAQPLPTVTPTTPRGDWIVQLNITFPERRRLNSTERARLDTVFGHRRRRRRGRRRGNRSRRAKPRATRRKGEQADEYSHWWGGDASNGTTTAQPFGGA